MFIIQQALCQGLQTLPQPKQQLCSSVAVIVAADVVVAVVVDDDDDKDDDKEILKFLSCPKALNGKI